ncbi:DUF7344 domain-containing protein [Haladaptatus sp. NG-SE-30]
MTDPLSADEIFDVLGHRHRRHTVAELLNCDDETTITELAEAVGRRTDSDPERIEVGLYHSHLPHLEYIQLVEYDTDAGVVHPTGAISEFEPFFELIGE